MIHIYADVKHDNSFTNYCKGKGYESVTCECIAEALRSNSTDLHKKANFLRNTNSKFKKCKNLPTIS